MFTLSMPLPPAAKVMLSARAATRATSIAKLGKTRSRTAIAAGLRRRTPSSSATSVTIPRPLAAASSSATLAIRLADCGRYSPASSPASATIDTGVSAEPLPMAAVAGRAAIPRTIGTRRKLAARSVSFEGKDIRSERVASLIDGNARMISCGERRSGSGSSTSNPMTAGCMAAMSFVKRATVLRGHGHCPTAVRLAWSMSTMTTCRSRGDCGHADCSKSK
jgi:hypothetical protein